MDLCLHLQGKHDPKNTPGATQVSFFDSRSGGRGPGAGPDGVAQAVMPRPPDGVGDRF